MTYTEEFFSFPMRIYDGVSLRKALKQEEDMMIPMDGEWVQGTVRLPIEEVKGWFDVFSKGRKADEVEEEGFDSVVVLTYSMGEYECMWTREKFEAEMDKFYERHLEDIKVKLEKELLYENELNKRVRGAEAATTE